MKPIPFYLAGTLTSSNSSIAVQNKYKGTLINEVYLAEPTHFESAIVHGESASKILKKWPSHRRKTVLEHVRNRIQDQFEEFQHLLTQETGKTLAESAAEINRALDTLSIAAEESVRINGQFLSTDRSSRGEHTIALTKRFPIGLCAFIAPFNFPLNLALHKIAPALAVGNPFILKPASLTPLSALKLGTILAETDLPIGAFSILPADRSTADILVSSSSIKLLSFTGSPQVGWDMKSRAKKARVVLELGGNAACILDETYDHPDLISKLVSGSFAQAGQSCISIQRILIHQSRYDAIKDQLIKAALKIKVGDPEDLTIQVGPVINRDAANRLTAWIKSAEAAGATVLCGAQISPQLFTPYILENVPHTEPIYREEAFGPVVILESFATFEEAIQLVNDSKFGLQTGILSRDYSRIMDAFEDLDVGAIIAGDVPSFRLDHLPYGGIKDSGEGREGITEAILHMTESKGLVIKA